MLPFEQRKCLLLLQPVASVARHGGFMKGRNVNEIIHRAAFTDNGKSNVLFPKGEQVGFLGTDLILCGAESLQNPSVLQ